MVTKSQLLPRSFGFLDLVNKIRAAFKRSGATRTLYGAKAAPYTKAIVCLANSYKAPNGRCIAGREVLKHGYGDWIRPVSDRDTGEVSFDEYRYRNNETPALLDIIEIPLLRPQSKQHQTENHVLDADAQWVRRGRVAWEDLEQLRDKPPSLWTNNECSSSGAHDRTSEADAAAARHSLVLIQPQNFSVRIGKNQWTGKRNYRGLFKYNGTSYNLSVTDPAVRSAFGLKDEGSYPLDPVYLCISLTAPYEHDRKCYKLVAAVISRERLK